MDVLFILLAKIIGITLDAVTYAMIIRMIMPIFTDVENSRVYSFVTLISEPFIVPVRFLFYKFNILQDSPIDWSFTVSYLLIIFIRLFLPTI